MNTFKAIYIKLLGAISILAILFHLSILLKLVPYELTWGGKLKTDSEMYIFETISILINAFFIFIILQKGDFIKLFFNKKFVSVILWIFFAIFVFNTIGNFFAETTFEKAFAIVTLVNSVLLWKINRATSG